MANTNGSKRFYVYAIASDGKVIYIGKGTGNRHKTHLTNSHNPQVRAHVAAGCKMKSRILMNGLTEPAALMIERAFIDKFRDRLANADRGVRSMEERILWELRELESQMKPEWVILAEGDWNGVPVERRLQVSREIDATIFELKMKMESQLGICHG